MKLEVVKEAHDSEPLVATALAVAQLPQLGFSAAVEAEVGQAARFNDENVERRARRASPAPGVSGATETSSSR